MSCCDVCAHTINFSTCVGVDGVFSRKNAPHIPTPVTHSSHVTRLTSHNDTQRGGWYDLWGGAGALEGIHAGGRWGPMARRRRRFFRMFCAILTAQDIKGG